MATTWVGDDFRGSGNFIGANAPFKEAAVGAWANSRPASASWARSGGGAVATFGGDPIDPTIQVGSSTSINSAVVGVTVIEAAVYGPMEVTLRSGVDLNGFGPTNATLQIDVTGSDTSISGGFTDEGLANVVLTGVPVALATRNVLRMEISSTQIKCYVNNVLRITQSTVNGGVPAGRVWPSTYTMSVLYFVLRNYPIGLSPLTLFDYVNVVRDTTSGPLGSPSPTQGASVILPHTLVAVGGQYGHGTAAYSLPRIYTPAQVLPPAFWAGRGTREVP